MRQSIDANALQVTVLTLTWNQKQDTLQCLESLFKMHYPNFNILLVDNGSQDGTVTAVRDRYPDVEIIENPENYGFQGGFNVGLRYALAQQSEYIFMINNDTEVAPDILDILMQNVHEPGVGLLSPKIYYADEPTRIWSVGGMRHPWTYEMTSKGDNAHDHGQWNNVIERDYLVGCALLMTRAMLQDVGLFDEGYFPIYYEDMDLSLRARQAGYRLLLIPQAHMWHKVSAAAGGSGSPRERYLMARNSVRFFRKHTRGWRWVAVAPFRFGSEVKTVLRLLIKKRKESAWSYLRGLKDGFGVSIEAKGTPWTS